MALHMSGFAQQQAEDARRRAAIAAQAPPPDHGREDAPVVETEAPDATKEIPQQHPSTRTGQTNSIPVVPTDLRHHKAWVLWKFERDSDKDKPRKVPYYIDGRRRSGVQGCGADRSALATYDRAAAQFQRGGYAGIGLAILPEWGLVALDFDKVVVDGQIQQDVQNLIDITYSEFSPSGTGVRAIFLGTVPANRKDNSPTAPFQVEFFSSKGFVTVTGEKTGLCKMLGLDDTIAPITQDVLDLYQERFGSAGHSEGPTAVPVLDVEAAKAKEMLDLINPDCGHDVWFRVGLGLHHQFGADGFDLWNEWSARGTKYPGEKVLRQRWRSIRNDDTNPVTISTVKKYAREAGWREDLLFDVLPIEDDAPPALPADNPARFPAPFRGPMAEAVTAALAIAPKPQPELTTLAALIGMASACPGTYHLRSGGRLNLYGCGVAETAEGKDMPRKLAMEIARTADANLLGKPASGQGLEDVLEADHALLLELDEVAHLFAMVNAHNAPPHLVELAGVLLRLFSASNGKYNTRLRAAAKHTVAARTLDHPTLNLLGFATPDKLGEALSASNIEDGLLGRFLFAFGQSGVKPRRTNGRLDLPSTMSTTIDAIRAAIMWADVPNLAVGETVGHHSIEIQVAPDADARLDTLIKEFDARRYGSVSPFAKALFGRSFEKAERVAGVLAVWDDPMHPTITMEHVAWAEQCLLASDNALVKFSSDFMHGGQTQADAARVLRTLDRVLKGEFVSRNANESRMIKNGMAPWSMVMRASKLEKRRMDEAVENLCALGDVTQATVKIEHANGSVMNVKALKNAT